MSQPIRVLVVEDSQTQRRALISFLTQADGFEVAGEAADGLAAAEATLKLKPDIILMDVRMPTMDGLAATRKIMREHPTPILLMTAQGNLESEVSLGLKALEAGALDLLPKFDLQTLAKQGDRLLDRLRLLAGVPVISHVGGLRRKRRPPASTGYYRRAARVVAIVASTGGPKALHIVLSELPATLKAAVVVVQHLDAAFVEGLVKWLNELCQLPVCLPKHDEELLQGVVYVCPPGRYAEVTSARRLSLSTEDIPVGGHCPSGDRLLSSVAEAYEENSLGVVLTGMGADGAKGLLDMRAAGAATIAQDEATSVIYGMPREATINGAAKLVLPLDCIAAAIARGVG